MHAGRSLQSVFKDLVVCFSGTLGTYASLFEIVVICLGLGPCLLNIFQEPLLLPKQELYASAVAGMQCRMVTRATRGSQGWHTRTGRTERSPVRVPALFYDMQPRHHAASLRGSTPPRHHAAARSSGSSGGRVGVESSKPR